MNKFKSTLNALIITIDEVITGSIEVMYYRVAYDKIITVEIRNLCRMKLGSPYVG